MHGGYGMVKGKFEGSGSYFLKYLGGYEDVLWSLSWRCSRVGRLFNHHLADEDPIFNTADSLSRRFIRS